MATAADVAALSPELGAFVADAANAGAVALALDLATSIVGASRFDGDTDLARTLLAAHVLTSTQSALLAGPQAGGGAVSAMALGPASVSFAAAAGSTDAELASTTWGRLYIALRRKIRGRGSSILARTRRC